MANIKIIFGGTSKSGTEYIELKAYVNDNNELFISIQDDEHDYPIRFICFDYDTSVAFVEEIHKCIGSMNENES